MSQKFCLIFYGLWAMFQHIATHCNARAQVPLREIMQCRSVQHATMYCNALQHAAAHCNAQQHMAIHCNTLQRSATRCNALQHTATNCNTVQRSVSSVMAIQSRFICKISHDLFKDPFRMIRSLISSVAACCSVLQCPSE